MFAQRRFIHYRQQKAAIGLNAAQILDSLAKEMTAFEVRSSSDQSSPNGGVDGHQNNFAQLSSIDELLEASIKAVVNARGAVSNATQSCAHVETGSQAATNSSEAIRVSIQTNHTLLAKQIRRKFG